LAWRHAPPQVRVEQERVEAEAAVAAEVAQAKQDAIAAKAVAMAEALEKDKAKIAAKLGVHHETAQQSTVLVF
jgi:hypothetical protein